VVLLSCVATTVVEVAKGMLEWMNDAIMKKFDNTRENQFNLRCGIQDQMAQSA